MIDKILDVVLEILFFFRRKRKAKRIIKNFFCLNVSSTGLRKANKANKVKIEPSKKEPNIEVNCVPLDISRKAKHCSSCIINNS